MKLGTCHVPDKMQHLHLWSTLEPRPTHGGKISQPLASWHDGLMQYA